MWAGCGQMLNVYTVLMHIEVSVCLKGPNSHLVSPGGLLSIKYCLISSCWKTVQVLFHLVPCPVTTQELRNRVKTDSWSIMLVCVWMGLLSVILKILYGPPTILQQSFVNMSRNHSNVEPT